MKQARDVTSHTYDESEANEIVEKIVSEYCKVLTDLNKRLETELRKEK